MYVSSGFELVSSEIARDSQLIIIQAVIWVFWTLPFARISLSLSLSLSITFSKSSAKLSASPRNSYDLTCVYVCIWQDSKWQLGWTSKQFTNEKEYVDTIWSIWYLTHVMSWVWWLLQNMRNWLPAWDGICHHADLDDTKPEVDYGYWLWLVHLGFVIHPLITWDSHDMPSYYLNKVVIFLC